MVAIPIRIGTTILDEIENVYDDITKRAYEIFRDRRGACALDLEDWLEAEKQLLWKPDVQLIEKRDGFIARIELRTIDPAIVNILVTPDDLVVHSSEHFGYPRVFRALHFPRPINPNQVHAGYAKGRLVLVARKTTVNEVFGAVPGEVASRASRIVHR